MLELINGGTIKRHVPRVTFHFKTKADFVEILLNRFLKGRLHYMVPDGRLALVGLCPRSKLIGWLFKKRSSKKV